MSNAHHPLADLFSDLRATGKVAICDHRGAGTVRGPGAPGSNLLLRVAPPHSPRCLDAHQEVDEHQADGGLGGGRGRAQRDSPYPNHDGSVK